MTPGRRPGLETAFLWLGPAVAALVLWLSVQAWGLSVPAAATAAVTAWCAVWWLTEPVPIPVTSLLPMALLPLAGALTPGQVAESYGSPLILLLLGGFMLSGALAKSGAHRRLAMAMIRACSMFGRKGLVLGFMLAAATLSMWISNTATTLMLLPVALAVLEDEKLKSLTVPLLLGTAYAASLGGTGTPIGTPPNLIYMQVAADQFQLATSFPVWMSWGLPVVALLLPIMFMWLTRRVEAGPLPVLEVPGRWSPAEKRIMFVFVLVALAWITRTAPGGGWQEWLALPNANDAAVALLAVVLMCVLPDGRGKRLLDWERASTIPWGVLLLFAGGICLARGFVSSGLSDLMGLWLSGFTDLPLLLLIAFVCLCVTFMTEATSNTASTSLLMPVLAAAAIAADIAPEIIMVPAAMSASCAFMLPVATAPNSVVYGSGLVSTARMAREGLQLNLLGVVVISVCCYVTLS